MTPEQQPNHNAERPWGARYLVPALVALILAFACVALTILLASHSFAEGATWTDCANRGDFFGGHIAAGSGLAAFFVMFSAFLLQALELKRQHLEFQKQSTALENSAKETHIQNQLLRDQIAQNQELAKQQFLRSRTEREFSLSMEFLKFYDIVDEFNLSKDSRMLTEGVANAVHAARQLAFAGPAALRKQAAECSAKLPDKDPRMTWEGLTPLRELVDSYWTHNLAQPE